MNHNEILKAIGDATKALSDNEKFALPLMAVKASKAAAENPHDASLVTMSNVLQKMASTPDKMFISRVELNKLYDQLYTPNTKIAEVFAEELDRPELDTPKLYQRDPYEATSIQEDYTRLADPVLANALGSLFDKDGESKLYSGDTALAAERICMRELNALGVPPKQVNIFAGQEDILICNAKYETPKGQTNVLVPVEIAEKKPLFPTIFLSTAGWVDLSRDALETHIEATAGKSYKVNGAELLRVLSAAKNGIVKTAGSEDVEMALIRMRAEGGTVAHDTNAIVYQKVDDAPQELVKTEYDVSFEDKLSSVHGQIEYLFGAQTVKAGRDMLMRKLGAMGYKPQISVTDSKGTDTLFYAVALDRQSAVKIPVKVEDGMVLPPSVVIASGKVAEFSPEGIASVLAETTDPRMSSVASPMFGLTAGELLEKVKVAIHEGNVLAAEDAIDVLAETDEGAYKTAVALFMESLGGGMEKTASTKGCDLIVKNSAHAHPICGHLNLPLHKVYQDENGDCQPLYRKAMKAEGETATFMAHKVLL